jgi:hypothetical protein
MLAVPVAPPGTVERLYGDLDELICLEMPEFTAISQFYAEFPQLTGSPDRPHEISLQEIKNQRVGKVGDLARGRAEQAGERRPQQRENVDHRV